MTADWDAGAYHRVSAPQVEWGRRVLDRLALEGHEHVIDIGCGTGRLTREVAARVPQGRVVAVDRSASMLRRAGEHLAGASVALVRASADSLPFAGQFDVVFSTATFHWVLDHEALFRSLFAALRPGGRLHAQCGGGPNLARLRGRAADLIRTPVFAPHFASGWREPWHYAEPDATKRQLREAGFTAVTAWLEPAPVTFPGAEEFRMFAEAVCLHPYLGRLPEPLKVLFADALVNRAAADDPPFTLDYCRLNLGGVRPGSPPSLP
ncbi:MAG TPA: methyltransferase domain-containing protein [Vicinamibacterales bacterium]|nr:methyltransferase domain-containing protein [Vicinamibacterales bacterium]